jgi:hypothetical protein
MTNMATDAASRPTVVIRRRVNGIDGQPKGSVPAFLASGIVHLIAAIIIAIVAIFFDTTPSSPPVENEIAVRADDKPEPKHDFTNEDQGLDPAKQTNYNIDRIEQLSVPGPLRPEEPVGIKDANAAMPQTISPPPGLGGGAGSGNDVNQPGLGNLFGDQGGYLGGRIIPGQIFGGRSGSTREKMTAEGGGNAASEAAVAKGLAWLKRQQKPDGRWPMVEGYVQDEFGATGLALLPFLAAGITHRADPKDPNAAEYIRTVDLGLRYLVNKQQGNGLMGTQSKHYSHAICTMALCEAYGMTNDQSLRRPAQRGLDYLVKAQNSAGGFRYEPNEPGDTSVTGWCLQAMQSGKLAGLSVPPESFYKVGNFLDNVQTQKGAAYGYVSPGGSPNMTSVGLLCRAYLGCGPKNPAMIAGVENLKKNLPRRNGGEIYYYYYATQVMHFCASENDWLKLWNPRMRDLLIETQDTSAGPNRGSWAADNTFTGRAGGRLCATSLSLLTLEVYYRHLPLYKRDQAGMKELE